MPTVSTEAADKQNAHRFDGPRVQRILLSAHLVVPLALLSGGILIALVASLLLITESVSQSVLLPVLALSVLIAMLGFLFSALRFRQQLFIPLARLEESVAQVCQGEPNASLEMSNTGVLGDMTRDIESLNEELTDLYEDMDNRVARQTTRLAQKTASLKILYDVAANINQAQDIDELLLQFLRVLKEMVNGLAATVRVEQMDGGMRLVGSIGLDNEVLPEQELLPLDLCLCGTALSPGDILCENKADYCTRKLGRKMFSSDEIEVVTVPIRYHEDTVGVYDIYVRKPGISGREDILDLLTTIGSHLGVAMAKQRSDCEARRLSIVEERTALAHELHDSLAQTLASLRFQVRMLEDTLQQGEASDAACDDLQRIRNAVEEAHTELRELLNSFRAPMDERGLLSALEKLVERFSNETGVATYFHKECRQLNLSTSEEMQMLRIVQEALANIRKHSKAHTVRVLFTCRPGGTYSLLVEDDGVGFDNAIRDGSPGEHIGLSIMEERALRLGGSVRIESEPGEGTRVELTYKPVAKLQDVKKKWIV